LNGPVSCNDLMLSFTLVFHRGVMGVTTEDVLVKLRLFKIECHCFADFFFPVYPKSVALSLMTLRKSTMRSTPLQVIQFLEDFQRGKIRGVDYFLVTSACVLRDRCQPQATFEVSGFLGQDQGIVSFVEQVAKSAESWKIDSPGLCKLIRLNSSLLELSKTALFLLLICITSRDLVRYKRDRNVSVPQLFDVAFGHLMSDACDHHVTLSLLSRLAVDGFHGDEYE
jgi:hypothetical protein